MLITYKLKNYLIKNKMNFIKRLLQRVFIFIVSVATLWIISIQIFDRLDEEIPFFLALFITYVLSAYFILPQIIHLTRIILRRSHIPKTTYAFDGLAADPINIIILGSKNDLIKAFMAIGWHQANSLNLKSAIKMIVNFILNKPYHRAPFSSLYLFGRKQDFGFQESINNSPRKRNHVRFWAVNIDPKIKISDIKFWTKKHTVDLTKTKIWAGAAIKDLGFGLTQLTYQITHRTDKNVDKQREYILKSLEKNNLVYEKKYIDAGEIIKNKYISDGKILYIKLAKIKK